MSEYITLASNVNFEQNSMSDFRTQLAKNIKLDENWVVGLSEISYTKSWYNILNDYKITLYDELGKIYGENSDLYDSKYIITAGLYDTPQKLVNSINQILTKFTDLVPPKLVYNEISNYVTIICGKKDKIRIFIDLGEEIENILGLADRKLTYNYYKTEYGLNEYAFKSIFNSDEIKGFHPVEISGGYHSLYLYTDIVYPSLVGDTFAPLMRVIEISRKYKFGETVHIIYNTPHYRPIRLNQFETIEISIKDDNGKSIPFKFGRVMLTLHFKNG